MEPFGIAHACQFARVMVLAGHAHLKIVVYFVLVLVVSRMILCFICVYTEVSTWFTHMYINYKLITFFSANLTMQQLVSNSIFTYNN